jgi:MFS family permease
MGGPSLDSYADVEGSQSSSLKIFDPTSGFFKAFILLGACFLTFGSYYCYDIVGALSPILLNPFYDINNTQESLLYAVYSLPNTVLPFFGGIIVDKYLGVK